MNITAESIIAAARECLDTPFRHQGRSVGQALDCAGLIVHVAQRLGIAHDDVAGYSRRPTGQIEAILNNQDALRTVPKMMMQAGDILLMRFTREPQHLGIYTGDTLIHCYEAIGRCVEHRLDDKWHKRIVRVYRMACISE